MNSLINQLNQDFCEELNQYWMTIAENFDGQNLDIEAVASLSERLREAMADGYRFEPIYSGIDMVAKRILHSPYEPALNDEPGFQRTRQIETFKEAATVSRCTNLASQLTRLHSQYMNRILDDYALTFTRQHGPFHPSAEAGLIYSFVLCGEVGLEMMLLSVMDICVETEE